MQKIFLLRHGETPITGTYVGSTDCGLSDFGVAQVKKLAQQTDFHSVQHVIASPMLRCVQTVEHLNIAQKLEYKEDLREIDFGLWEGLTFQEVSTQYPDECEEWFAEPGNFHFPQGESIVDFTARISRIPGMLEQYPDGDILVVAHGGVIRHLICLLLGFSFEKFNQFRLDVARYATIELYEDSAVLAELNKG